MSKRMIFHIPQYIEMGKKSGSQLRPVAMLEAFRSIGYEVDVVMGYGAERKKKIKDIKENIINGIKYDFMYSESSTMPTLLTEKDHLPRYFNLDFQFMKFCKGNGIKIGLFYRDIFWRFELYRKNVPFLKRAISLPFYYYDLRKYQELVDILYLPSQPMYKYIPIRFNGKVEPLPPAVTMKSNIQENMLFEKKDKLTILYVGGISELYSLETLFEVIHNNENLNLILCCRENEWIKEKFRYERYLNSRVQIIHKSGQELEPYYYQADILNLFIKPIDYWEFVMPVKLFEYLGHKKPIIAVNGTVSGQFVAENNIGWTIDYSEEKLNALLNEILLNQEIIIEKSRNAEKIIEENTWEARARKVARELS